MSNKLLVLLRKRAATFFSFASTVLVLILTGCASAPMRPAIIVPNDYEASKQYLAALIQYQMKKNDVTGLSIALVDDQRIVWKQGFGYADKAQNIPATPETLYRVASISKLFTATAAMQLAEQGRMDIDKPLQTYIPEFSMKASATDGIITPRNIMTHHSGLPRDYLKGMFNNHPQPFTDITTAITGTPLTYPTGLIFSYSNVGITLLGHAIQNVTGKPFEQHLQESVLQPLGMKNSSFTTALPTSSLMSKGYRQGVQMEEPALSDTPAGGLNTNVLDLSRFLSMTFAKGMAGERQILKADTVGEMLRPQNADVPLDLNFHMGLGWILSGLGSITIENAGTVAHHGGASILFHSQTITLPEHKLGVIVLSNSATSSEAVNIVATEALQLALEIKTGIKPAERPKVPFAARPLSAETAQSYVGDYTTFLGHVKIFRKGDSLRADAAGKTFTLLPRTDGQLGMKYALLGIFPVSLGELDNIGIARQQVAGRDMVTARLGNQQLLIGEKIQPVALSNKWLQRLGEYEITNLDGDELLLKHLKLSYENEFLLLEFSFGEPGQKIKQVIAPISDESAILLGPLRDYGEHIEIISRNGEERVYFSGYELRKKQKK